MVILQARILVLQVRDNHIAPSEGGPSSQLADRKKSDNKLNAIFVGR